MTDLCTVEPKSQAADLTVDEQDKLHKCERVIIKGIGVFCQVGRALITIRDERLYRALAPTFEQYTKLRFGFTASRARQLIKGAVVADRVESVTRVTLPSEKIARELNRLPKDQQAGCWQDIVTDAGGAENVTAAKVKQTVDLWIADNEPYRPVGDDDHDHDGEALDQHVANLVGVTVDQLHDAQRIRAADPALSAKCEDGEVELDEAIAILDGQGDGQPAPATCDLDAERQWLVRTVLDRSKRWPTIDRDFFAQILRKLAKDITE